jgi:O-antigen/teichoic acid export membrane protein
MSRFLGRNTNEHAKSFLRAWFRLVSGSMISSSFQILGLIILTGGYSPSAFGEYAIILSTAFILTPIATGRVELGIVTSTPGEEFRILVSASIARAFSFFVALQICLELIVRAEFSQEIISDAIAWRFLPLLIMLFSLINILMQISIRNQSFKAIAQRQIFQNLATVALQISFSTLNQEVTALILGEIGGRLVSVLMFFSMFRTSVRIASLNVTFKDLAWKSWRYRKAMLASLVDTGSTYIFFIAPAVLFGPTIGGVTAMGFRIATLPNALIGATLGQIFLSFSSPNRNWGTGDVEKGIVAQLRNLLYLALFISSASSIGIAVIASLPWTNEWSSMLILIPFLFLYTLTSMVWNPFSTLTITSHSWDNQLNVSAIRFGLLLSITLFSYFSNMDLIVFIGLLVISNSLVDILAIFRLKSLVHKNRSRFGVYSEDVH